MGYLKITIYFVVEEPMLNNSVKLLSSLQTSPSSCQSKICFLRKQPLSLALSDKERPFALQYRAAAAAALCPFQCPRRRAKSAPLRNSLHPLRPN